MSASVLADSSETSQDNAQVASEVVSKERGL